MPLAPALLSVLVVEAAPEVEVVEPPWPPLLLESLAVELDVDAGVVVIAGIVVKPEVSPCDGWQASTSPRATKVGRDRGHMARRITEVRRPWHQPRRTRRRCRSVWAQSGVLAAPRRRVRPRGALNLRGALDRAITTPSSADLAAQGC